MSDGFLLEYMADCRSLVMKQLATIVPSRGPLGPVLYDLVFDYPLREAKALRPALCVATCRALGGALEGVLNSATVIELFHNAFLIHDDVEDGSEKRRAGPTLHRVHGSPVAINVGDAMFALTLEPLLDNTRLLDLGRALRILRVISRMVRESAEGQAMELAWIREASWTLRDRDYLRMVHKKTTFYTFLTPVVVGALVAGAPSSTVDPLRLFATSLGSAFQIQDDVLNVSGTEEQIGKEIDGDLWEGKHTLILLHAVRACSPTEKRRALSILRKPRPTSAVPDGMTDVLALLSALEKTGEVTASAGAALRRAVAHASAAKDHKSVDDVLFLRDLVRRHESVEYARSIAIRRAKRARRSLDHASRTWAPSVHKDFLHELTTFVVQRDH